MPHHSAPRVAPPPASACCGPFSPPFLLACPQTPFPPAGSTVEDFYTDDRARLLYKGFLCRLVTRCVEGEPASKAFPLMPV
jgi:hypothetical protein